MDPTREALLQTMKTIKLILVACIYGNLFMDVVFGYRPHLNEANYDLAKFLMVILLMILGLLISILHRPKVIMEEKAKVWIAIAHSKLLLTLLFVTPVYGKIMEAFDASSQTAGIIQLSFLTILIFVSSGLKFYRETYSQTPESYKEFKHN